MSERKLSNRRRKKFPKGRALRVSNLVYDTLEQARAVKGTRKRRSWDSLFRRMLGLPTRAGVPQPLIEGMLEQHTGMFVLKLGGTQWSEVETVAWKLAALAAKQRKANPLEPIRLREVL